MPNFKAHPGGRLTVTVIALAGVLLMAACSAKGKSSATPTTSAAATSTSTTTPSSTSTTAAALPTTSTKATPSSSTTPAQPALCTTGQLTITIAGIQGGLGHAGEVILFKNTGNACQLHGYPGADGVNDNGVVVVSARRTPSGYLGGLPSASTGGPNVTLTDGQTASALFEGINGAVASLGPCPDYTAVAVTPPNETHTVHLSSPGGTLCYPEIHPVVAGMTGDATVP